MTRRKSPSACASLSTALLLTALALAGCARHGTIALSDDSRATVCLLIGVLDENTGQVRPPQYNSDTDDPKTIRDVQFKIAQGAAYGCWHGEFEP